MDMRALRSLMAVTFCVLVLAGGACRSGPEDSTITASVKSKLAADTTVPATTINVDTKDGAVTLTGTVDNAAAKTKAETIAKGTEGVKSVTNNITVRAASTTTAPPAPTTPAGDANDTAIKNAIMANLTKEGVTGVTVDVASGVATLKGSASRENMQKALKAANEAKPQAKQVMNQITVK